MNGQTIKVAERIMLSAQRDLWALADAVLADVPARPERGGGSHPISYVDIGNEIAALALALDREAITKADGSPYTPSYLANLRDAAMAWSPEERQAEASFEAHRKNGGESRPVFLALCAVARGENVARPEGVDATPWRDALAKLETRRHGFKVQTQAVRIAMELAPKNTPTRLDKATLGEFMHFVSVGIDGLAALQTRYAEVADHEIPSEDLASIVKLLRALVDRATMAIDAFTAKASDEGLADLLESER